MRNAAGKGSVPAMGTLCVLQPWLPSQLHQAELFLSSVIPWTPRVWERAAWRRLKEVQPKQSRWDWLVEVCKQWSGAGLPDAGLSWVTPALVPPLKFALDLKKKKKKGVISACVIFFILISGNTVYTTDAKDVCLHIYLLLPEDGTYFKVMGRFWLVWFFIGHPPEPCRGDADLHVSMMVHLITPGLGYLGLPGNLLRCKMMQQEV